MEDYINTTLFTSDNSTNNTDSEDSYSETALRVAVGVVFSLITICGFVGNVLVLVVVAVNQQMRNTTNILIMNLAVADLSFIILCVPFTALSFIYSYWPFGKLFCSLMYYVVHVTAWASVWTLVLMSLDRYLAVVHAVKSMTIRTQKNTIIAIAILWAIILAVNIPSFLQYSLEYYNHEGEERARCADWTLKPSPNVRTETEAFYWCFFIFAYAVPLLIVCTLYFLMLRRLLCGHSVGTRSAESTRAKKKVTRMVVVVVVIFALCWLPIQILFLVRLKSVPEESNFTLQLVFLVWQIIGICLAYMNSCVNPILYAFFSQNFRKAFAKIICCGRAPVSLRVEFERTSFHRNDLNDEARQQLNIDCQKDNGNCTNGRTYVTDVEDEGL